MSKRNKTAPELEMLILQVMQTHAVCQGVNAVTVVERPGADAGKSNWEVSHVFVAGGPVPPAAQQICEDAVASLREEYDLMTEYELGEYEG